MVLDSGVVTLYRQVLISENGDMPDYDWQPFWESYFGSKTVGVTRYYIAKAQNDNIDLLIEVQRNEDISAATDCAKISDKWYRITQIQHLTDDDGLPVTDLSLERIEGHGRDKSNLDLNFG